MAKYMVKRFKEQPLAVGDKLYIEDGRRRGDWEVMAAEGRKVTLRCPVTHRVLEADPFYILTAEIETDEWPSKD